MVKDIEKVGPYWVLNVRLDHRPDDASLKTEESERRVPLHPGLVGEGFIRYVKTLKSRDGSLFPNCDLIGLAPKAARRQSGSGLAFGNCRQPCRRWRTLGCRHRILGDTGCTTSSGV